MKQFDVQVSLGTKSKNNQNSFTNVNLLLKLLDKKISSAKIWVIETIGVIISGSSSFTKTHAELLSRARESLWTNFWLIESEQ